MWKAEKWYWTASRFLPVLIPRAAQPWAVSDRHGDPRPLPLDSSAKASPAASRATRAGQDTAARGALTVGRRSSAMRAALGSADSGSHRSPRRRWPSQGLAAPYSQPGRRFKYRTARAPLGSRTHGARSPLAGPGGLSAHWLADFYLLVIATCEAARLCCFLAYGFIFKSVPEIIFSPFGKANLNFDKKKKLIYRQMSLEVFSGWVEVGSSEYPGNATSHLAFSSGNIYLGIWLGI